MKDFCKRLALVLLFVFVRSSAALNLSSIANPAAAAAVAAVAEQHDHQKSIRSNDDDDADQRRRRTLIQDQEQEWGRQEDDQQQRDRSCRSTGNPIDDCWRCDPHWHSHRKRLADCAIGFGKNTIGGRDGDFYTVTDPSDDPVNPRPGSLRYGAIQDRPLWIIFARDMTIVLSQELIVNSHKTIDGRGHAVRIAYGGCLTVQYVRNVIVHGIGIHSCRRTGPAMVRSSPGHVGWRTVSDGDGISIFGSRDVWIDHCFLADCADGLIDAIMGSTGITISNNYFRDHNKVMLLGHSDSYTLDKMMQVTIAFNHFGEGLVQRMPRCRYGYFHIVNNHYTHWRMYAIGGSANPTINSQGNRFVAPADVNSKQVTKREFAGERSWMKWNWRSEGDSYINGAYFRPSGAGSAAVYAKASSLPARPAALVPAMTAFAGPLNCRHHVSC
ncbi:probable pectate lyase 5 isoform X2 [Selaginella moellendorffii]|uniref:probable pectate lyase 5 isoform X2 n=1 Tax=Selaginella moellendorffii TaxID=88036 RepID=UPI000D1CF870|nr:probable pectate lyase 5 isoform X2 [Selaginella moellendorffii]|eukprot:XP_002966799.2 probable pectate lyase 5 isoform X2 [Selaginella moellendorffii]